MRVLTTKKRTPSFFSITFLLLPGTTLTHNVEQAGVASLCRLLIPQCFQCFTRKSRAQESYQSSVTPLVRGTKALQTLVLLCLGAMREERMVIASKGRVASKSALIQSLWPLTSSNPIRRLQPPLGGGQTCNN